MSPRGEGWCGEIRRCRKSRRRCLCWRRTRVEAGGDAAAGCGDGMGLRASYVGLSLGCLDVVAVFEFEKVAEQPANRGSELFLESGFVLLGYGPG
jgi:hypothetical protein